MKYSTGNLDPRSARPLTSREIAKILSGLLGTLAEFCEPEAIEGAMAHFSDESETYKKVWREIRNANRR